MRSADIFLGPLAYCYARLGHRTFNSEVLLCGQSLSQTIILSNCNLVTINCARAAKLIQQEKQFIEHAIVCTKNDMTFQFLYNLYIKRCAHKLSATCNISLDRD